MTTPHTTPLVSVIMPIYNAGKDLYKSVSSLSKQSYSNIEIILVNDKSPDNSYEICLQLAKKDSRIKIINKSINEGQELARWTGIEHANGEYVMFIDQDDYYQLNAVEILVNSMHEHQADIVYGGMTRRIGFLHSKDYLFPPEAADKLLVGEIKNDMLVSWFGVNILPVQLWGYIFKKSLFYPRPIHTSFKLGEDLTMSLQIYQRASRVFVLNQSLYVYNWGGITSKFQPTLLESAIGLYNFRREFLKGHEKESQFIHYMNIEMMHFMATFIRTLILLDRKDSNWYQRHLEVLARHEANPIWDCVDSLQSTKYALNPTLSLIIHKQFCACYKEEVKKSRQPINLLKIILRGMLEKILRLYYR